MLAAGPTTWAEARASADSTRGRDDGRGASEGGGRNGGVKRGAGVLGAEASGRDGVLGAGVPGRDGQRGEAGTALSEPQALRTNHLKIVAGLGPNSTDFASEDGSSVDTLLPRPLFSVSDAAQSGGVAGRGATDDVSPPPQRWAAAARGQHQDREPSGNSGSPAVLAGALGRASRLGREGPSAAALGDLEGSQAGGGRMGSAFILGAAGARPSMPPEGINRCAPSSPERPPPWSLQPSPRALGVGGGIPPAGAPTTPGVGLFSGRQAPGVAPHAMTGLVGGVIPRASAPRGTCEIRGAAPHLWALAAEAMGLRVLRMSWADRGFGELMTASGVRATTTTLSARSRGLGRRGRPDLVFSDQAGLASSGLDYWGEWECPHVFFSQERASSPPPRGWTTSSTVMQHWEAGGSTDAAWRLEVWLPPGVALGPAPARAPQPWIPLLGRLDKQVRSAPCAAPVGEIGSSPEVLWTRSGDRAVQAVSPGGLFPHDRLSERVLVPDDWSPTGFGTRPLSWSELGDLWDIPILLQDLIKGDSRWSGVVCSLVKSPPAKLLLLGGDSVVTRWLRGGALPSQGSGCVQRLEQRGGCSCLGLRG
jgi:hypothetical protein